MAYWHRSPYETRVSTPNIGFYPNMKIYKVSINTKANALYDRLRSTFKGSFQ